MILDGQGFSIFADPRNASSCFNGVDMRFFVIRDSARLIVTDVVFSGSGQLEAGETLDTKYSTLVDDSILSPCINVFLPRSSWVASVSQGQTNPVITMGFVHIHTEAIVEMHRCVFRDLYVNYHYPGSHSWAGR